MSKPAKVYTQTDDAKAHEGVKTGEVRCYRCYEFGHRASARTNPAKEAGTCLRCGRVRHLIRNCPSRTSRESVNTPGEGPVRPRSDASTMASRQEIVNPTAFVERRSNGGVAQRAVNAKGTMAAATSRGTKVALTEPRHECSV